MTRSGYASATYLDTGRTPIQNCSLPTASNAAVRLVARLGRPPLAGEAAHAIAATPSRPLAVIAAHDSMATYLHLSQGWTGSGTTSIESWHYPGYYLRHQDYRVKLHTPFKMAAQEIPLFRQDSTFLRLGVWQTNPRLKIADAFRSVNYPDRNIRHYRSTVEVTSRNDPRGDRPHVSYDNDSRWEVRRASRV